MSRPADPARTEFLAHMRAALDTLRQLAEARDAYTHTGKVARVAVAELATVITDFAHLVDVVGELPGETAKRTLRTWRERCEDPGT